MRRRIMKKYVLLLGVVSLLVVLVSCGWTQFFGQEERTPTGPCEERIPKTTPVSRSTAIPSVPVSTSTPDPSRTPIPIMLMTPIPGSPGSPGSPDSPLPSDECDGPGQVLICDGEEIEEVEFEILKEITTMTTTTTPATSTTTTTSVSTTTTTSVSTTTTTTLPLSPIILYTVSGVGAPLTGNLVGIAGIFLGLSGITDGRDAVDGICSWFPLKPSGYTNYRGFISVASGDAIADMVVPTNREIQSPVGTKIADDWAGLLDGSIDNPLNSAGVTSIPWWSGSNSDGSIASETCNGWTDGTSAYSGGYGSPVATDSAWISGGTFDCDTPTTMTILCIAY